MSNNIIVTKGHILIEFEDDYAVMQKEMKETMDIRFSFEPSTADAKLLENSKIVKNCSINVNRISYIPLDFYTTDKMRELVYDLVKRNYERDIQSNN